MQSEATHEETPFEAIEQILAAAGVAMASKAAKAPADAETWQLEGRNWRCTFTRGAKRMAVPFTQGSAHTEEPTAVEVMNCLVSDADVANAGSFEQWASDLGYSADSRSAEKIYRLSWKQTRALKAFLGKDLYLRVLQAERL